MGISLDDVRLEAFAWELPFQILRLQTRVRKTNLAWDLSIGNSLWELSLRISLGVPRFGTSAFASSLENFAMAIVIW